MPNSTRRWKAERVSQKVAESSMVLAKLTDAVIIDLLRRGEQTNEIDGYPTSTWRDGGPSGGGAVVNDEEGVVPNVTGVEAAMFRRLAQHESDVIGEALDALFTSVYELAGHAAIIAKNLDVVLRAGEKVAGRVNQMTLCQGCHRDVACTTADPIRAGYCHSCDSAWYRFKQNEDTTDPGSARMRFEAQRERFEGHHPDACPMCADPVYKQRIAS